MFSYKGKDKTTERQSQDVNTTLDIYGNASFLCNYTSRHIWHAFDVSLQLPKSVFLICSDRAWVGIPRKIRGGPCSLEHFTQLTPNITMMHQKISSKWSLQHKFASQHQDEVAFWRPASITSASIFAPGAASAYAVSSLNKLSCCLAKQSNNTSVALSRLLLDVNSIRHAKLQTEQLYISLLPHGHGCQNFKSMCCMNLSNHSKSVYKSIANLKERVNHWQVNDKWR